VLVVEDDAQATTAIERVLRRDWRCLAASSLASARVMMATVEVTAALVDLGLPDGSGLELVDELCALAPPVPVLVVTGMLEPELVNRAQELGVGYVCKPVSESHIRAFLGKVGAHVGPRDRRRG